MLHGAAATSGGSCVLAPCASASSGPKSNRPPWSACAAWVSAQSSAEADAGQQRRALAVQGVEGAGLDQRLDDAPVDRGRDRRGRRNRTGCGTAPPASRAATMASIAPCPVPLIAPRPKRTARAETGSKRWLPALTSGGLDRDAEALGVDQQRPQLVAVVDLDRHVGGEELGRVVHLDPGRLVGEQRVGGGVRLVEAVAGELLHQVEDFVGDRGRDALLGRALAEDGAVGGHLLGLLLAHRPPQQVGAAERVAAQHLRGLHHLLLVDHDPVGLAEHGLEQRMRIAHRLAAVLARAEARDVLHRAGPEHGVERDQVLEPARLGVLQHALHAGTFELEHRLGPALGEQRVDRRRRRAAGRRTRSRRARGSRATMKSFASSRIGQRRQAEEVELDEADRLDVVLVELAHRAVLPGCR